ncbi:MAG: restriction endonuclease subunit S [Candidatus Saccharicenans sp.]|nr:restriction endonuclease subunit S [Candidatus Saccharicenans sp.]
MSIFTKKLKEIAEIIMGQSPPGLSYNENGEGLPFYQGVKDFQYRFPVPRVFCTKPTRIAKAGDILFSVRAPIGKVNVANHTCAIGRGLAIIRPHENADSRFIEFVLCSFESNWHAIEGSGSVFGNATKEDLETLEIPWPDVKERRAIAHILGTLDDKIELNRRTCETLEQIARGLFKSWFVDFEPVRAKMSGRWKKGQSLPGLPAHLWDLFPDRLLDSELGQIPEGWEIVEVGREVELIKGVSYRSEEISESDVALVTLKCFNRGGGYRSDALKPYIGPFKSEQIISPGELILAQTDITQAAEVIGKPALVLPDERYQKLIASLDVLIIRPYSCELSSEFFYLLFFTNEFTEHIYGHVNGTTVLHLHKNGVSSFRFVKPPETIAKYFSSFLKQLFKLIMSLTLESRTLAGLRDALLPKLISGVLHMEDAAKFILE